MSDESHEKLVQIAGQAPNIDWIDDFFDLLNNLLSFAPKRFHEPLATKVTTDEEYRNRVFREAFTTS